MEETDRDVILSKTSGGYDVFSHYFGDKVGRLFCNRYRKDSRPSCKLYFNNERYFMRDYGSSEWSGDCFRIVAMINNLSETRDFHRICCIIDKELNLNVMGGSTRGEHTASRPIVPIGEFLERNPLKFSAVLRRFTPDEILYWKSYGIDTETLERYNVSSIERCVFTKTNGEKFTVFGSRKYPYYGYFFNEGKGAKFYRPTAGNRFMYGGQLPSPYIFGSEQLSPRGSAVYITGGEKDVLSLAAHGFNAVCFNSETAALPPSFIKDLTERFDYVIIMYDSDDTGKKESQRRVRELNRAGYGNVCRLVLPLQGTKQEKDISDFFRMGNDASSLRRLTQQAIYNDNGQEQDYHAQAGQEAEQHSFHVGY